MNISEYEPPRIIIINKVNIKTNVFLFSSFILQNYHIKYNKMNRIDNIQYEKNLNRRMYYGTFYENISWRMNRLIGRGVSVSG